MSIEGPSNFESREDYRKQVGEKLKVFLSALPVFSQAHHADNSLQVNESKTEVELSENQ